MSDEESSELMKSWIFVNSGENSAKDAAPNSGIEEVVENDNPESHVDSDTDSISVISESGCSYKTDEEEFVPATNDVDKEEISDDKPELKKAETVETVTSNIVNKNNDNGKIEKILYFATSAVCALILIGFSVAVQHYFFGSSNIDNYNNELDQQNDFSSSISQFVKKVKSEEIPIDSKKTYNPKKKNQIQNDNAFHDKITLSNVQIKNNDLTVEENLKTIYKSNKNKIALKSNKENSGEKLKDTRKRKFQSHEFDETNKREKSSEKKQEGETCNKKIKELKMKEEYLKEKEKFLIEKEHDLMKKEIKLNKEKHHEKKYDKKPYKKGKETKYNDMNKKEKKEKYKTSKDHYQKNTKKYKNKENKKHYYYPQNYKFSDDEQNRKRNISGQWYINLHKARTHIRQKEQASDWVFDRARLRSMKRNKAHWYFQWMVDRARLRVK